MTDLRECDASFGGKAANLARLLAAGLPVPEGFALSDGQLDEAAAARAAAMGAPFAVRSSADLEDKATGAAPGVFESATRVALADLPAAVAAVWSSGTLPIAVEYAHLAGADAPRVSVIVQRFVEGTPVIVYTRPPGRPDADEVWIQRGEIVTKLDRSSTDARVQLAMRAEVAIEATRGADVELVEGDGLWVVQARPIVHPPPPRSAPPPPPPIVLAALTDGRVWTWDVAHNPDPLSTAQAGLVERVERAGVASYSLRVCAGYLYSSPKEKPDATGELEVEAPRLEREMLEALATAGGLREALDGYVVFYRAWNELSALLAATPPTSGSRPSAVHNLLAACARGELTTDELLARIGDHAPAWDVASPTFAERRDLIDATLGRLRASNLWPKPEARSPKPIPSDWRERDDHLFAKAQASVRKAILSRAEDLGLDPDDAFWIPLDDLLAGIDRDAAHRRAAGARAAATRAAGWSMPLVVGGSPHDAARRALRGVGTGGRARGKVVRFASLASAMLVERSDVIVTRAITPALAVFAPGCAAIVSETGGLLDHGAAMARELGIPCVVGCADAYAQLLDGTLVLVDADAGTVEITGSPALRRQND